MKNKALRLCLWGLLVLLWTGARAQLLLEENFNYGSSDGNLTTLSAGSWSAHSSGDINPIQYLANTDLTFSGYDMTGGGVAQIRNVNGEDVNRSLSNNVTSGTVYAAALMRVSSAAGNGDYVFHFMGSSTSNLVTRLYIRPSGSGFQFGLLRNSGGSPTPEAEYESVERTFNTTYLVVIKHDFGTGQSAAFIFDNTPPAQEPTPNLTSSLGTLPTVVSGIALRQGTASNMPFLLVDGIRVATTWACAVGGNCNATTATLSATPTSLTFGQVNNGDVSAVQTYTLSGSNLTGDVTVTAPAQFQVSKDGVNFSGSVTLVAGTDFTLPTLPNTTIHVRFAPTSGVNGVKMGDVANSSPDAATVNVAVQGEETGNAPSVVQVATVAQLRQQPADGQTVYELTGEVLLTFQQTFRNQKFVQDNTAGILIDDNSGIITTTYNVGDGITGLRGRLSVFGGMLQLVPAQDPGAPSSTGNTIIPVDITLVQFINDFEDYESRLVRITDQVTFQTTGNFANGQVYNITDGQQTAQFRTTFFNVDYIGQPIPQTPVVITGIPNERTSSPAGKFITARNAADIFVVPTTATLSATPTSLTFGQVNNGDVSAVQTYTLSGSNLTGDVTVTAPAQFQVSKDGVNFSGSVTLVAGTDFTLPTLPNTTIHVRFAPTSGVNGVKMGDVANSSPNAATVNVAVQGEETGNAAPASFQEDFESCEPNQEFIASFLQVSVTGAQRWICSNFGRTGRGAQINGFASGSARDNEDWLISPPLSLAAGAQLTFSFRREFNGPDVIVKISTDYVSGNPNDATWTDLRTLTTPDNQWTDNIANPIDLAQYANQNVRIAFYYTSVEALHPNGAARWTIDDVVVTNATIADEPASTLASFRQPNDFMLEGQSKTVLVDFSKALERNSTLEITLGGSAVYGSDYTTTPAATAGRIVLNASTGAQGVQLIVAASNVNDDRQVTFTMSNATGDLLIDDEEAITTFTLDILDKGLQPRPIALLQTLDPSGVSVFDGAQAQIEGVAHGINIYRSNANSLQFALVENNPLAGIQVRHDGTTNLNYTLAEGDRLRIQGTVRMHQGMTTIEPTSIERLGTANLMEPIALPAGSIVDESYESLLIRLSNLRVVSGWGVVVPNRDYWAVVVTDEVRDYIMRVYTNSDIVNLTQAPTYRFELTGIVMQDDELPPFDSGYQIMPRRLSDIRPDAVTGTEPALAHGIIVYPNPSRGKWQVENLSGAWSWALYNARGEQLAVGLAQGATTIEANLPTGLYFLHVRQDGQTVIKKLIVE